MSVNKPRFKVGDKVINTNHDALGGGVYYVSHVDEDISGYHSYILVSNKKDIGMDYDGLRDRYDRNYGLYIVCVEGEILYASHFGKRFINHMFGRQIRGFQKNYDVYTKKQIMVSILKKVFRWITLFMALILNASVSYLCAIVLALSSINPIISFPLTVIAIIYPFLCIGGFVRYMDKIRKKDKLEYEYIRANKIYNDRKNREEK